ncbi:hypothetical protein F5Y03DRAFT_293849 [Xylaria venustula]|nr:hypothetical protein F5Y03DRAFT_293849 [Xylaria venustula]
MPTKDRARVVCTNCHSRKIKCDLQTSSSGAGTDHIINQSTSWCSKNPCYRRAITRAEIATRSLLANQRPRTTVSWHG